MPETGFNPDGFIKTEEARKGRSNQVYSKETGARVVAGCIPLNESRNKIIMISSSKHKDRWILPKGGVESDEQDNYAITAKRETWEEAGVTGIITKKLPVIQDSRFAKPKGSSKKNSNKDEILPTARKLGDKEDEISEDNIPRSEYHFYEMEVDELSTDWPEAERRLRKWCSYSEAKHELLKAGRLELVEALNESNILKDSKNVAITDSGMMKDADEKNDDY